MDPLDITYQLKRRGFSQADIARTLGVTPGTVGNVIHDRLTAYEVASHVAALLGQAPADLWPARYTFKPRGRSPKRRLQLHPEDEQTTN